LDRVAKAATSSDEPGVEKKIWALALYSGAAVKVTKAAGTKPTSVLPVKSEK